MRAYRANILFTPTPDAFSIVERGYVIVNSEGLVEAVTDCVDRYQTEHNMPQIEVTDYGDRLLIPAFNDLHIHAPQYRNLGLGLDEELLPWLNKYTFPEEAKFADSGYAERIYRRFVHELWMQGTMRSCAFATIHPETTKRLMQLFREAGLGGYVGLVGMDRNSPDNLRNTPKEVETFHLEQLEECLSLHSDRVRTILTPRFIPSCTPEMLRVYGRLAGEHNLPVQSHLSENRSEIEWVKELEPLSTCYADAYRRYGLLGQTPTLMAHCCYSAGEEMQMLKENKVTVVHCPTSNTNLASGIAPVATFLKEGINVGLGTDVSAGHYMSMLRVMQYAIQVSKLHYARSEGQIPFLSLSEAFYLATKAGGSFFGKVGSFEKGYAFDALVIDDSYLNYDHYTLADRIQRFVYVGDDRDIRIRFCQGQALTEPIL
ncbi:MAG: amidohydrolase family protein [Paludibacteraceae bacterium]|nr:amidohydrolase family protein [Paludibacteraceae bacterium]